MDFVELNKKRNKYKIGVLVCGLLSVISFIVWGIAVATDGFFIILGLFLGVIFIILTVSIKAIAKNHFKKELVSDVVKREFPMAEYKAKEGIAKDVIMDNGLFRAPDLYRSEDLIAGTYNDLKFKMSDFGMWKKTGGRRRRSYRKYAAGRIVVVDFQCAINNLKVIDVSNDVRDRNSKSQTTNNSVFNGYFNVYAECDDVFSLLNEKLVEFLISLKTSTNGKIYFSIKDNNVFFVLDDMKDSLEISIFKEINDDVILSFKNQLKLVKDLIDILNDEFSAY